MADKDGDGSVTKQQLVEMLSFLPVQWMLERQERSLKTMPGRPSLTTMNRLDEEEETEEADVRAEEEHIAYVKLQDELRAERVRMGVCVRVCVCVCVCVEPVRASPRGGSCHVTISLPRSYAHRQCRPARASRTSTPTYQRHPDHHDHFHHHDDDHDDHE